MPDLPYAYKKDLALLTSLSTSGVKISQQGTTRKNHKQKQYSINNFSLMSLL